MKKRRIICVATAGVISFFALQGASRFAGENRRQEGHFIVASLYHDLPVSSNAGDNMSLSDTEEQRSSERANIALLASSVAAVLPDDNNNNEDSAFFFSGAKYRYYIYEEEAITKKEYLADYRKAKLIPSDPDLGHVVTDARSEEAILLAMENHPWRTKNPEEADLFIVSTPVATLLAAGGGRENSTLFDDIFRNLTSHALFQKNEGHRHIIVSLHWAAFTRYRRFAIGKTPGLHRNVNRLKNVTIASHFDQAVIKNTFDTASIDEQKDSSINSFRGFNRVFAKFRETTCCSFSLDLWSSDVPLIPASYVTWKQRSVSIFYHTRKEPFAYSTPYRHGPLNLTEASTPAKASIGLDIPP